MKKQVFMIRDDMGKWIPVELKYVSKGQVFRSINTETGEIVQLEAGSEPYEKNGAWGIKAERIDVKD